MVTRSEFVDTPMLDLFCEPTLAGPVWFERSDVPILLKSDRSLPGMKELLAVELPACLLGLTLVKPALVPGRAAGCCWMRSSFTSFGLLELGLLVAGEI